MKILESLLLNWIPLFVFIYGLLWFLKMSGPIDRFIRAKFTRLGRIEAKRKRLSRMSGREKVQYFAKSFLNQEAAHFFADPFAYRAGASEDDHLLDAFDFLEKEHIASMTESEWGELLVGYLIADNSFISWMDWKYNLLTLLVEEEWSDLLNELFKKRGLAPVTDAERQSVLKGYPDIENIDQYCDPLAEVTELQPIARKRGHQLLQIFNDSDQSLLISLPLDEAKVWENIEIGYVTFGA